MHGFYATPGSRNGGQDTAVVDVFFGHRTYNSSKDNQINTLIEIHKEAKNQGRRRGHLSNRRVWQDDSGKRDQNA